MQGLQRSGLLSRGYLGSIWCPNPDAGQHAEQCCRLRRVSQHVLVPAASFLPCLARVRARSGLLAASHPRLGLGMSSGEGKNIGKAQLGNPS